MPTVTETATQKEYEKISDLNVEQCNEIQLWLKKQCHLPHEFVTELDIILALHSCDYSTERTKNVIDLNYTLRTLLTFYQNRIITKSLKTAFHTWLMTPLLVRTTKGYRAIYCQLINPDPAAFNYSDVIRAFVMMLDLWQYEEGTVPGVAVIVNMANVSLGHLSRIDLNVAQQFFYFLQEAMYVRLKEFHFINAPSFMDRLVGMVRPFMKKEMLDMLLIHQAGAGTLEEFLPREALPSDAGGENKQSSELRDEMWHKIENNNTFFEEESKKRVDESKRAGGPKSLNSFFSGIESSFKRLEID